MLFVFLFAVVLSPLAFALSHAVIREGLEKGRLFPDGKKNDHHHTISGLHCPTLYQCWMNLSHKANCVSPII